MPGTTDDTVEIFPALRVDRSLLEAVNAATADVRKVHSAVREVLIRAREVASRMDPILAGHPLSWTDDFPQHVPVYAALHDAVGALAAMVDSFGNMDAPELDGTEEEAA